MSIESSSESESEAGLVKVGGGSAAGAMGRMDMGISALFEVAHIDLFVK